MSNRAGISAWIAVAVGMAMGCAEGQDAPERTELESTTAYVVSNPGDLGVGGALVVAAPATITSLISLPAGLRLSFTLPPPTPDSVRLLRMDRTLGYYVRYATLAVSSTGSYVYDDSNVVLGREYCYIVVTSVGTQTSGTNSPPACAAYGAAMLPAPPTGFTLTSASERALSFGFTDASTDETAFIVERAWGNAWLPVYTLPPSTGAGLARSFSVDDLDSELDYCYRVRSINANGFIAGPSACGRTLAALSWDPVPSSYRPDIITITHPGPGQLMVQWLDGSSYSTWTIEAYDGMYGAQIGAGNVQDHRVPRPLKLAYTMSGLEPGRLYCFRVNRLGSRSLKVCESPRAARTAVDQREPGLAALPVLSGITPTGNKSLQLTITSPQPGQMIEQITAWDGVRVTAWQDAAGQAMRTDSGLIPGQTYCYRIWVFNQYGSRYGNLLCATTPTNPPGPPSGLHMISVDLKYLAMGWSAGSDADSYEVAYHGERMAYTDHDGSQNVGGLATTISVFEGFTYCVRVRSKNAFGASGWTELCNLEVPDDHLTTYSGWLDQQTGTTTYLHTVNPGVGPVANLIAVEVVGGGWTQYRVRFLPPSQACYPGITAGVTVDPGQSLGATGLAALYGTATPQLPLTLIACKEFPPNVPGDLNDMPINVTFRQ